MNPTKKALRRPAKIQALAVFPKAAALLISLSPPPEPAEAKIWAAAPGVSFFQLKARTDALGQAHKTYAQNYAEFLARRADSFRLLEKIKKAQTAYLSGSGSKPLFLETANLAFQADWNQKQRRIILYAFLRLAQLEPEPDEKKAFLISAGRFIMEPLSPSYPEYNLFPPPLIKELNRLREGQNSFLMDWRKIFPHYEILFVNGKKIMRPKTRLNEGRYRIAALSSSRAPFIKTESLSGLLSNAPYQTAFLTTGPCRSAKIKPEWLKATGKRRRDFRLLRNCPEPYAFPSPGPPQKADRAILSDLPPARGRALLTVADPAGDTSAADGTAADTSAGNSRAGSASAAVLATSADGGASVEKSSFGGGGGTGAVQTGAVETGDLSNSGSLSGGEESAFSVMTGKNAGFSIPIDSMAEPAAERKKTLPKWLAGGGALLAIGILIALSRPDSSPDGSKAPLQQSKIFY